MQREVVNLGPRRAASSSPATPFSPGGAAVNSQGRKPLEFRKNDAKPWKGDTKPVSPLQGYVSNYGYQGLAPPANNFRPFQGFAAFLWNSLRRASERGLVPFE